MDLDDLQFMSQVDKHNQLSDIQDLPDHLEKAFELAGTFALPEYPNEIRQILLCGMGESASGGELAAAYALPDCLIPVTILHNDDLPTWAGNRNTLVIVSSQSGNTVEANTVYRQATSKGCPTLAITTGGQLAEVARQTKQPVWEINLPANSRAWLVYLFGSLLVYFYRSGLIPNPLGDLPGTLQALRNQQDKFRPEVAVVHNPAKRLAGQMVGRGVVVFSTQDLEPVVHRWKNQINMIAKAWAQFECVPEGDHNILSGIYYPEDALTRLIVLFLAAPSSQPLNQLRLDRTRQIFLVQGINTDLIQARGDNRLTHLWTLLQFGDYASYYLAVAYKEDPTPAAEIRIFNDEIR